MGKPFSALVEFGLYKTYCKDKTFSFRKKHPTGDIFDIPVITLVPDFDANFNVLSVGLQIEL